MHNFIRINKHIITTQLFQSDNAFLFGMPLREQSEWTYINIWINIWEDRPSTSTSNPTRRTHTLPDLNLSPMEEEENYDLYNEKNLHRIEHNIEKQKQERYAIEVSNMKDN